MGLSHPLPRPKPPTSELKRRFFTELSDRFSRDGTIHFLQALQDEFGENLLDNAPSFPSDQGKAFIEDSKLKVTFVPTGSPDSNPVEECWRQLKRSIGKLFPAPAVVCTLRSEIITRPTSFTSNAIPSVPPSTKVARPLPTIFNSGVLTVTASLNVPGPMNR